MLKYFRNRKTIGYLVGSALLVLVILAFIVLYIPDFMGPGASASLSDEVANVEGVSISARLFLQRYRAQERMYRAQLGNQMTPAMKSVQSVWSPRIAVVMSRFSDLCCHLVCGCDSGSRGAAFP